LSFQCSEVAGFALSTFLTFLFDSSSRLYLKRVGRFSCHWMSDGSNDAVQFENAPFPGLIDLNSVSCQVIQKVFKIRPGMGKPTKYGLSA
jgi:hypothetical protein